MKIEPNNIYNGDCLELMKEIPDNTVDMVLCDLPYGVLRSEKAKWDKVIPMDKLWEQYERVCKDKANIVLFGQGMFSAKVMMSKPKFWRYNLVWYKECVSGFLDANRRPLPCHEDIIVFTNGGGYGKTYNPQMIKVGWHLRNHTHTDIGKPDRTNNCYGNFKGAPTFVSDKKFPRSIISFKKRDGQLMLHPTEKPVALLRYLIKTYSEKGDVVLDNTMGCGSTCVACAIEKRSYIGIEKEQKYYDIAKKRIEMLKKEPEFDFDYE